MSTELPRECLRLLKDQGGVITIGQAVSTGLPAKAVRDQVRAGRWQVMQRGVYAAFTGRPTREAELWAALLRAGPAEAVLSHQTAAELWGLLDGPSRVIHVTVPHDSNPERRGQIPGAVVHRSRSLQHARHPVAKPPRTRVEETVLDLVDCARSFEEAYGWICCAIGRRRTTAARIRVALLARPRIQGSGRMWGLTIGYARGGALSVLEFRYVRGVEHAPWAPPLRHGRRGYGMRQAIGTWTTFMREYHSNVEIDGAAAHPEDEQWRDKSRDRWNAVHAGSTLSGSGYLT